jgi:hypothetical protein
LLGLGHVEVLKQQSEENTNSLGDKWPIAIADLSAATLYSWGSEGILHPQGQTWNYKQTLSSRCLFPDIFLVFSYFFQGDKMPLF